MPGPMVNRATVAPLHDDREMSGHDIGPDLRGPDPRATLSGTEPYDASSRELANQIAGHIADDADQERF